MQEYKFYLDGKFCVSARKNPVVNPATEEVFAQVYQTEPAQLIEGIKQARQAGDQWKKIAFKERAKLLREIAQAMYDNLNILAELETRQIGKPFKESLFVDISLGAQCFSYYAAMLETLEERSFDSEYGREIIRIQPYGVAGIFLPYNVPLMIFGFTCAAALAAGNALIIKPSDQANLSMLELAKYLDKLDMPKGLISVVTGKGSDIGTNLAQSPIDLISFTGSRETLQKITAASAAYPKKIICELGGNNIAAVFDDADTEDALANILAAAFMKQGQICIGTSIALVQEGVYKDFRASLVKKAGSIKSGDPFDAANGMGPLPAKVYRDELQVRITELQKKGVKVLCGGKVPEGKGWFYPATVLESSEMVYEEFFAPVLLLKSFKDKTEAEKILAANPTGLVTQLWTKDEAYAQQLASDIDCGTIWINSFVQMSPATPFGGAKQSGWGRNLGKAGFFEYSQVQHIGLGHKKSPVVGWFGV